MTHVPVLAFVVALGAVPAAAQTPAPAPRPVTPGTSPAPAAPVPVPAPPLAVPRAVPDPVESIDRAREALDRARVAESLARARAAAAQVAGLTVEVPQIDIPDIELPQIEVDLDQVREALENVEFRFRDFGVEFDDVYFDLNHDFDFDFTFDGGAFQIARDAREMALAATPQGPAPAAAPAPPAPPGTIVRLDTRSPQGLYDQARSYIDRDQYERALQPLDRLIAMKGARADAAMYWRAYSLSKLGRNPEALTTLSELRKQYPNSSWLRDAGFLEIEVKQAAGQPVSADAQVSEEIRLLALQGIMRSDPATAIPVVEKTLAGNASIRVKERALFVLSQSREARAREVLTNVARSTTNPDLKVAAIRYLGRSSAANSAPVIEEIYRGTNDADVKRAALQALATARAGDRLASIARTEKDPDLRRAAVRYLGTSGTPEAAEALRAIYGADATTESRRAVIDALAMHRNGAAALVALARAEKDPELKREMVRRLSNSRAPEAQAYMLELLK